MIFIYEIIDYMNIDSHYPISKRFSQVLLVPEAKPSDSNITRDISIVQFKLKENTHPPCLYSLVFTFNLYFYSANKPNHCTIENQNTNRNVKSNTQRPMNS